MVLVGTHLSSIIEIVHKVGLVGDQRLESVVRTYFVDHVRLLIVVK